MVQQEVLSIQESLYIDAGQCIHVHHLMAGSEMYQVQQGNVLATESLDLSPI